MCIMTARKRGNKIEDWRKCKVVKLADGASSRRSQAVLKQRGSSCTIRLERNRSGGRGRKQQVGWKRGETFKTRADFCLALLHL